LGGGSLGLAESYLISPGILLTGGNRATLRFWHQYDFLPQSDFEIQLAAVFIITNIATEPVLLAQLPEDATDDWEEFTYDLTPYLGHVVYIAWYYFLFSMEDTPRLAGWWMTLPFRSRLSPRARFKLPITSGKPSLPCPARPAVWGMADGRFSPTRRPDNTSSSLATCRIS
jgi:hypothetical protein